MRSPSLVLGAAFATVVLGCSLGIDEDQIQSAGGSTSTLAQTTAGQGGATGASTSQSGGTGTASSTVSSMTATSSTSTGMMLPQVKCVDQQGNDVIDCPPGLHCCFNPFLGEGRCSDDCDGAESKLECDGPEDCPGTECCAPDEAFGDVKCEDGCADDDVVCKSSSDCNDTCSEPFPSPLNDAYTTCF